MAGSDGSVADAGCKYMKKIRVKLGKRSYDIVVSNGRIDMLGRTLKELRLGKDTIVVTNQKIKRLLGDRVKKSLNLSGFAVRFEVVPDSEKAKSERYCLRLLNNISRFDNSRRRIVIIALGGGVIGDLAGFVASIYRRGVPYIQVPTTLLSQVDSAIGGKVAIDLKVGKNLAGSFYQPRLVFSDISILRTLPKRELISGLAEVVKYGIIKSPGLFEFLEENYSKILRHDRRALEYIVYTCSLIKARVVEKDEHDNKGIRVILNLGHTVGHAIEASGNYNKLYTHGHAVALGMLSAAMISKSLGLLDKRTFLRIKALIKKLGLPTTLKRMDIRKVFVAQEHDKKFIHGKNRFVLPLKIGKVTVREGIDRSIVKDSVYSIL